MKYMRIVSQHQMLSCSQSHRSVPLDAQKDIKMKHSTLDSLTQNGSDTLRDTSTNQTHIAKYSCYCQTHCHFKKLKMTY